MLELGLAVMVRFRLMHLVHVCAAQVRQQLRASIPIFVWCVLDGVEVVIPIAPHVSTAWLHVDAAGVNAHIC
jgi:hypothetical protein